MIRSRNFIALILMMLVLGQATRPTIACGPAFIDPIFVFRESPDLPFENFTNGNIGIVLPTFGRKTLVVAYRYLNGGSFTHDEQKELIKALKGTPPDGDGDGHLKAWIKARKEFVSKEEPTPEIYVERQAYGGYDFFPNCASNAFAVATETLKDRGTRFGSDSQDVRDWLAAQDTVFKNCVSGSHLPGEVGRERPEWLRKDREYQTAAALFYSLKLDEARARFAAIAADINSPWQETADYLVGRTLVRQASLSKDEAKKRLLYDEAELTLMRLVGKGGNFAEGSRRLLGLVKYRLRPETRVRELARSLAFENGNQNLRQDLIDYVWLVDKFESRAVREEAERQKDPEAKEEDVDNFRERYEAVQKGELIAITLSATTADLSPVTTIYFKPDTPESEVVQTFESHLGRKLTTEETKRIQERRESELAHLDWLLRPNRRLHVNDYEGQESPARLPRSLTPEFLLADDLSDWILTVQTNDPVAYPHAFEKWTETGSHAWLIASLIKARADSPGLLRLMRAAKSVGSDAPAFAGSLYHMVRLQAEAGRRVEARGLLDQLTPAVLDQLPVSAQNLFAEQRMHLAEDLTAFLGAGLRSPVAFDENGRIVSRAKFFEMQPSTENEPASESRKFQLPQKFGIELPAELEAELQKEAEAEFQRLLAWKDRVFLDPKTTEILNTHFPLPALIQVARSPALPDYLRKRIVLAIWTRAIVLEKPALADKIAPDILILAPEMKSFITPYINGKTEKEKVRAALFMLIKNPDLSPLIADGLPRSFARGDLGYYYETAWWCAPSLTDYTVEGDVVPKNVTAPPFLNAAQLAEAKKEQDRIIEIGDAKSYLGKRVLEWARSAADDPRIPEALFIAALANRQYKYGCDGWEYDQKTRAELERLLRTRFPNNAWTEKLRDENR